MSMVVTTAMDIFHLEKALYWVIIKNTSLHADTVR